LSDLATTAVELHVFVALIVLTWWCGFVSFAPKRGRPSIVLPGMAGT